MEFFANHFTKNNLAAYNLFILIGMNRFSYVLRDATGGNLYLKADLPIEMDRDIGEQLKKIETIDGLRYSKVKIAIISSSLSVVPMRLFDKNEAATYLSTFTSPDTIAQQLIIDEIPAIESQLVSTVSEKLSNSLLQYFPNAELKNHLTSLISYLHLFQKKDAGFVLFAHIYQQQLQLILFRGKTFIYCNSFNFENADDFIYYLMLIYNQFSLSTDTIPTFLSGAIEEGDLYYNAAYRFIGNLFFITNKDSIFPKKLQTHRLFGVLAVN